MLTEGNHNHNHNNANTTTMASNTSSSSSPMVGVPVPHQPPLGKHDNDVLHLRIKSFQDVEIHVPATSVVAHLKQQVRSALLVLEEKTKAASLDEQKQQQQQQEQEEERYIRLICKGRLLAPDTAPLSDFSVQDGDVVHAVLAPKSWKQPSPPPHSSSLLGRRRRRPRGHGNSHSQSFHGIIVGPGGRVTRDTSALLIDDGDYDDDDYDSMEDGDDEEAQFETIELGGGSGGGTSATSNTATARRSTERRGFDRLRAGGLSRHEITAIRTYFSRSVERHMAAAIQQYNQQQHSENSNTASVNANHARIMQEPDARRRRLLWEEDWMSLQGPTSEFRMNLNSNTLLRFALNSAMMGTNTSTNNSSGTSDLRSAASGDPYYWRSTIGTDRDFIWGFLLGFFVGFVMLVWVWMPTVPHKQKIGILTGISFQLAMNVLRQEDPDEFETAE